MMFCDVLGKIKGNKFLTENMKERLLEEKGLCF